MLDETNENSCVRNSEDFVPCFSNMIPLETARDHGNGVVIEDEHGNENFSSRRHMDEYKELTRRLLALHQPGVEGRTFLPFSQIVNTFAPFSSRNEHTFFWKKNGPNPPELFYAIVTRHYAALHFALNSHCRESINQLDTLGRTPLHLALLSADSLAVQLILSFPNAKKFFTSTPLLRDTCMASVADRKNGPPLNILQDVDFPDLGPAFSSLSIFHLPLVAGMALEDSVTQNHVQMCYTLLIGYAKFARGVLCDTLEDTLQCSSCLIFMKACGWNVNTFDETDKIMFECFREYIGNLFFNSELTEKREFWSIDTVDDRGSTALHLAASLGNKNVCELLIKAGANFLIRDHQGFLPIHRAIDSFSQETFSFFLSCFFSPTHDSSDFSKNPPSVWSEEESLLDLMKHCIVRGSWNCLRQLVSAVPHFSLSKESADVLLHKAQLCGWLYELESCVPQLQHSKVQESSSSTVTRSAKMNCPRLKIFTHQACFNHIPLSCDGNLTTLKRLKFFFQYPENSSRLFCLVSKQGGILYSSCFRDAEWCWDAPPAPVCDILRVHDWSYIHSLMTRSEHLKTETPLNPGGSDTNQGLNICHNLLKKQIIHLDADTIMTPGSWGAARHAAGCAIAAVKAVCSGEVQTAFCAIRPPGHHIGTFGACQPPLADELHNNSIVMDAHEDWLHGSQGFCLLNNVAVAAAYARYHYAEQGIRRIAIVDFDIHHGNGTEQIVKNLRPRQRKLEFNVHQPTTGVQVNLHHTSEFWKPWLDDTDSDEVFFISIHGFGQRFYPNTGGEECHVQYPHIRNVFLPPFVTQAEFRSAFVDRLILPLLAFKPDLLLVSSGFDGHTRDLVNDLFAPCCEWDFLWLTRFLVAVANECCSGRLVSFLEGGYNSKAGPLSPLAQSVACHVQALLHTSPVLSVVGVKLLDLSRSPQVSPHHCTVPSPPRRRKRAAAVRALELLNATEQHKSDEQESKEGLEHNGVPPCQSIDLLNGQPS